MNVVVVGAGAAGLMCAIEAGKRGRSVLILDHANQAGKKILLSGGGRCNFTHRDTKPEHYLSANPHFCISALKRFTPADFEVLVRRHHIPYHEKTAGQLFCDHSAKDILNMLKTECARANVKLHLKTSITHIEKVKEGFQLQTTMGPISCESLVIASGGLSFPTMGASPFGYHVAQQFSLAILPVRAALVPLTLHSQDLKRLAPLSGLSLPVIVRVGDRAFTEDMLFTHRGLSGPAILQISSYWQAGDVLSIHLLPNDDVFDVLKEWQIKRPKAELKTILGLLLPLRFAEVLCTSELISKPMNQYHDKELLTIADRLSNWSLLLNGTEGYRTAEVTLGGVDTRALSSKTFEVNTVPGLYFIGEVLDVTGHLGGFNFQWAWASGYCAGQYV